MYRGGEKCIVLAASALHDKSYLSRIRRTVARAIGAGSGARLVEAIGSAPENGLDSCSSLLVIVATGGTEEILLEIDSTAGEKPALFLALPYANGLPALAEASPLIRGEGKRRAIGFLPCIDCSAGDEKLREALMALSSAERMISARLGLLGGISPWLVYSRVDPAYLEEKIGTRIVEVELGAIIKEYRSTGWEEAAEKLDTISQGAMRMHVEKKELIKALKLYIALKRIITRNALDAITIKCFDIIRLLDTTACLPLSLLNSEGIVAGCEGDVPATLAMMAASWATGRPVFMGNPASIQGNRLLIAHCTAPLALAKTYELKTHFETGRGVGVALHFPRDEKAVLLRLSPSLDKARIIRGTIVEGRPLSPLHCRSQLWVELAPGAEAEELVLGKSMGNHYVVSIGGGDWAIRITLQLLGMSLEEY